MIKRSSTLSVTNSTKHSGVKWLHFEVFRAILFDIRALWRSGLSPSVPECQKIIKGGLDQYGPERFVRHIYDNQKKCGTERVNERSKT